MKRFACPNCRTEVHFESHACVVCGQSIGLRPSDMQMISISNETSNADATRCSNFDMASCNWIAEPGSAFCIACQHNRTVPDHQNLENRENWSALELAKRKMIYALEVWRLPHPTRSQEPERGLAFDFLADTRNADGSIKHVKTGHQNGVITLNIAEGDEAERVERKQDLREPYRTAVGHLRHEVGHFYWMHLIDGTPAIEQFRALFGDERNDYGQSLSAYYANGPMPEWQSSYISAYATAHPWEDFAETWAHWMHIVDGLETARAYGICPSPGNQSEDVYSATDTEQLVDEWVPLTVAVNGLNRGMGQPDLYPFVLSVPVVKKMSFINELIHGTSFQQH